ncbi:5-formyltetrahydrofolate cyclo-ligase [Shewanella sp. OPT22]|nr:5-formyltetrahydrofolate cyclo-ligase [Shewanella sp. OPT22]
MDRNAIRKSVREKRKAISQPEQHVFASKASLLAVNWLETIKSEEVALYLTHDGELDTQPLIRTLWKLGKKVYVPVLHPFCDGHLVFIEYSPTSPMVKNHYGISEPKLDVTKLIPASKLDVIFTPLVAFDHFGNRMGMGGGYYDRTLSSLRESDSVEIAGFAFECQKLTSLPVESWDVPLKQIITPEKVYTYSF